MKCLSFKNLIHGKLFHIIDGIFTALCMPILIFGIFMMVSVNVKAETTHTDGNPVVYDGNATLTSFPGSRSPIVKVNEGNALVFFGVPTNYGNRYPLYGIIIISDVDTYAYCTWGLGNVSPTTFTYNNKTYYGNVLSSNGTYGGSSNFSDYTNPYNIPIIYPDFWIGGPVLSNEIITYIFNNWDVDYLLENGNNVSEPEYNYDSDIGSLMNVEFKNVIDETGEANFLDISYSRYTSTGRDLSSSGYGIMSRLVYNDPNNLDSIISFPEFLRPNINDSTGKKALKLITWGSLLYGNAIADSIADLFSGSNFDEYNFDNPSGGGGHSFEFSQMDPYYDVILTPYFFDGTDYYYGDNTVINGVYFDQMGTRLIDDPDSDQTISITNVTINNYDYGIESQYINNGEITNIDSLQVYNYTTYVTDNSQTNIDNSINTTNISTTNIYNQDNNYRPFGNKNIFNGVTVSDILNGLQSVITAFAMAFPILGGLFDYLPWWAVDIASTCTVVLAAFAVLKVLKLGGTHVSNISS